MNKFLPVFLPYRIVLVFRAAVLLILSAALFPSCKSTKKTATENKTTLDFKSSRVLASNLKKNEFSFEWLSAKFNCEATIDSSINSFKVSMRVRKDSLLWFSISPALGIEVARAIITKDSIKFLNRLNSTYFSGGLNYVSKLLQTDLDYESLQSLLVGNSVDFYEDDEKLRSSVDNKRYLLSTIRKRKLRKAIEKNKELKDPVQSIWLDPATFKITQLLFQDFNSNREFMATFGNHKMIDSTYFPYNIKYNIKAEKKVSISIEYTKVEKGEPQKLPFSIPEKYEQIFYTEK